MIGFEELCSEAFDVLIPDRNFAQASALAYRPRTLDGRVSIILSSLLRIECNFPQANLLNCEGDYMRAIP
jgi:hypothetical protein